MQKLVDEPFDPRIVKSVLVPVGVLTLVLLFFSIPEILALSPRDRLLVLLVEGVLLSIFYLAFLFFLESRQELWVDKDARSMESRLVWRGRALNRTEVGVDEIQNLQAGRRFLRQLGDRHPLVVVCRNGTNFTVLRLPSLKEVEKVATAVAKELGIEVRQE